MKKFTSFDEYEKWAKSIENPEKYPCIVDDGWTNRIDLITNCKSYKTALRRFAKIFAEVTDIDSWCESIQDCCENDVWKDSDTWDPSWGSYYWAVQEIDQDVWYVFLNTSGCYAGYEK